MCYIRLYHEWKKAFHLISDEEAGRLIKAILDYGSEGELTELPDKESLLFALIKEQIDRDTASYEKKAGISRDNGKNGGRPPASSAETHTNPLGFTETQTTRRQAKTSQDITRQDEVRRGGAQSAAPSRYQLPLNDGTSHGIGDADIEKYRTLYPAVDVEQQIRSMIGWLDANPSRRKTRSGIRRFINSWLAKEQNSGKRPPASVAPVATEDLYATHEDWGAWTDDTQ